MIMKQYIAIFNWRQADTFIKLGCPVISIKKNDKNMIKFIFEVTPEFEKAMERWRNGEFRKNMKG